MHKNSDFKNLQGGTECINGLCIVCTAVWFPATAKIFLQGHSRRWSYWLGDHHLH